MHAVKSQRFVWILYRNSMKIFHSFSSEITARGPTPKRNGCTKRNCSDAFKNINCERSDHTASSDGETSRIIGILFADTFKYANIFYTEKSLNDFKGTLEKPWI